MILGNSSVMKNQETKLKNHKVYDFNGYSIHIIIDFITLPLE